MINPFFHSFGYKAGILACLVSGATIVPQAVFDVGAGAWRLIAAERITVLPGPPTLYTSLLDHPDRHGARPVDAAAGGDRRGHRAARADRADARTSWASRRCSPPTG